MNYDLYQPRRTYLAQLAANALLERSPPHSVLPLPNPLRPSPLLTPMMTPEAYLRRILQREAVDTSLFSPLWHVQAAILPVIQKWANRFLVSVTPSGSFSKGTANKSGTDIDLFISLSPATTETLKEIYSTLDNAFKAAGYVTRRQNVSINITVGGQSVDLVPGKLQNQFLADHSLYRRKADTWTKTNVSVHANKIIASSRLEEIRVLKLWRNQSDLDFPSFYLELTVLDALGYLTPYGDVANNVMKVFAYLRDSFVNARVQDPANTNNIISDDLTAGDKLKVRAAAIRALKATNWNQVVV
ncbi:nucleotidyltransferase domain-containing protein [Phenylobacterium sp.]|uniref:nucleotidyltransferase domain-containing protein n=1 Tax=Phenylobacterium sp. TaxID=1871053 RepID=UPI00289907DE|nr:nucleotidyltransferase domain-containing protein [Phenylobacterium sp.]